MTFKPNQIVKTEDNETFRIVKLGDSLEYCDGVRATYIGQRMIKKTGKFSKKTQLRRLDSIVEIIQ